MDSVWAEGVYLGHKTLSEEIIVGNKEGVFKSRTVRRVPVEDRWHSDLLQSLGGSPWKVNPQAEEAEQVMQDEVPSAPLAAPAIPPEPPHVAFREEAPHRVYVKTDVLKQIGYTLGCPGCRALQTGRMRVGHSDDCRKRAVETMKDTVAGRDRLSAARKREDDLLARAVQQTVKKLFKRPRLEESSSSQPTRLPSGGGDVIVATPLVQTQNDIVCLEVTTSSFSSSSFDVSPPAPLTPSIISTAFVPPGGQTDMSTDSGGPKRTREIGDGMLILL